MSLQISIKQILLTLDRFHNFVRANIQSSFRQFHQRRTRKFVVQIICQSQKVTLNAAKKVFHMKKTREKR